MTDSNAIFKIKTQSDFENLALDIFSFQFNNNKIYRSFCDLINVNSSDVTCTKDIPFLPIQFFKSHSIVTGSNKVDKVFASSGTTGSNTSKHYITDLSIYESSFRKGFKHFYGEISDYVILALLPSYLEREDSSLVYMVNDLINLSNHEESGFYLNNLEQLKERLLTLENKDQKTLLIGVSFALLDLVETHTFKLDHTIIMETGGMKGRRKEIVRDQLHDQLKNGFGVEHIHSEYGMTELLSQAYATGTSSFKTPPWMQVCIRDTEDALSILPYEKTGGINVIDLANINSCAFIATQDLGRKHEDGSFDVLGRFDNSDIRGCNLMVI